MKRPTTLSILLVVCGLLVCAPAGASERVVGSGFVFDLPDRFDLIPGTWQVSARATSETVVQTLPVHAVGPLQMVFYSVPGPRVPEATLLVCRFDLGEEDAKASVRDLDLEDVRAAYQHAVETLPSAKLIDCAYESFVAGSDAVYCTMRYLHPEAGERYIQSVLSIRGTTGLVVSVDAPLDMQLDYRAYFADLAGTIRIIRPAPTLRDLLRVPAYAAIGLLFLVLVVLVVRRRLRARPPKPRAAPARARILSCSPDFDRDSPAPPSDASPAAAPELDPEPDPEPAAESPVPASSEPPPPPPEPAPGAGDRVAPRGDPRGRLPPARAPRQPAPADAAPGDGAKPFRISRNTDFLGD